MRLLKRMLNLPALLFFFLREVLVSNMRVAWDVLTPSDRSSPAIVRIAIPELSDLQLLVLTSMITMTPGTLVIDISDDHRELLVHEMYFSSREALEKSVLNRFIPKIKNAF